MEIVALHGVKSKAYSKCEVPLEELGIDPRYQYPARDHARYERRERDDWHQSPGAESDAADGMSNTLGINMGPGIFHRFHLVSAPALPMPDLLDTSFLELFMHMMD